MGRLAVIGTFYQRREKTEKLLNRVLLESTRPPDEFWMMCEEDEDANAVLDKWHGYPNLHTVVLNTPLTDNGRYSIIPYSNKINWALDHTLSDYIVFLDNGSMPHFRKYELMAQALNIYPERGAVYCSQQRSGYRSDLAPANEIITDAYGVLNFTQVMYRKTNDRWSLDMTHADPDIADAIFWRELHKTLGPFYPVKYPEVLDEHYFHTNKAVGI